MSFLTRKQAEVLFQGQTLLILGKLPDPTNPSDPAYSYVRVEWSTKGQPGWEVEQDVVFLQCITVDDPYNKVRENTRTLDEGGESFTQTTSYTRVWQVTWNIYGPNSFETARAIRSGLFNEDNAAGTILPDADGDPVLPFGQLALNNVYFLPDVAEPVRCPEQENGQWWERVDFSAKFNELVQEISTVQTVESVEVITQTAEGAVVSDVTITGES
jgi:hypothetical protein